MGWVAVDGEVRKARPERSEGNFQRRKNRWQKFLYYAEKLEQYFFQKSVEIVETGINVVLDWGFWTKSERDFAKEFYGSRGIEYEFHYISISDEEWYRRLDKRNKDVLEKKSDAYFVDEGLAEKFKSIFEIPAKDEIDVWVEQ